MSFTACQSALVVSQILYYYQIAMIVYALVSWVPSLRGRWSEYLAMAIEPALAPLRRVIPPLGGLDLSFIVLLLLIQFASRGLVSTACRF